MNKQVFRSVVSENGNVTLPKALQDELGLRHGMVLEFHKEGDKITLENPGQQSPRRRSITAEEFLAMRVRLDRPFPSDEEIEEVILREAARRYREEID